MVVVKNKSMFVALLLTFLLGPLGMLYATVSGGLIMIGIAILIFFLSIITVGIASILYIPWYIGLYIWTIVAVNKYNNPVVRIG